VHRELHQSQGGRRRVLEVRHNAQQAYMLCFHVLTTVPTSRHAEVVKKHGAAVIVMAFDEEGQVSIAY